MAKNARQQDPIDKARARLEKAHKRLDSEQGMVARQNARHEVLVSLREYRRVLDRDFPIIAKKRKPRRRRTRIRDGYVPMPLHRHDTLLTQMAEAKVSIQVIRTSTSSVLPGTYVPEWAVAICRRFGRGAPTALRKAKKDRSFREVELAAFKLGQDDY